MGSAASNQNRVSSAELSRDERMNLNKGADLNNSRPHSSSPAPPRSKNTQGQSAKKNVSPQKTEVKAFSSESCEDTRENTNPPASQKDDQGKIREYEMQLAKSESQKLDLLEQLNAMKASKVSSTKHSALPPLAEHGPPMPETVHAKDQYIIKLEKDLQAAQREVASVRQKLKKRIKSLTNQLHEVRQEASINQMEMKAVISQQNEQIEKLKGDKVDTPARQDESGHSKIIVELSNQLSEQAEQIDLLKSELMTKDHMLQELEKNTTQQITPVFDTTNTLTDRLPSGRGKRCHKITDLKSSSSPGPGFHNNTNTSTSAPHPVSPIFERQSTALSDSDSDWELDSVPSKIHSAPAGARIKSAVSVSSTVAKEDATSVQGNDDSILNATAGSDMYYEDTMNSSNRKTKSVKRSALKNHLERKKNANQSNALIGPSLAFAAKGKEAPSDTSCEPTPRCADRSHLPGFSRLHVVNTVSH